MNRRRSTIQRAKYDADTHQVVSTGNAGPAATQPNHGKIKRVPYVAEVRAKRGWGKKKHSVH